MGMKKGADMTGVSTQEAVNVVAGSDDDSSSWEIIDPCDDDDEFDYYFFDEDELSLSSYPSIGSSSGNNPINGSRQSSDVDFPRLLEKDVLFSEQHGHGDYGYEEEGLEDEEQEEDGYFDDDDDDDDGYDLDDELVPRWVSDRFEKQRMRKLGKRAYPKMSKSKKMPHYYNRPGCVYGKHGLGLKHSI